MSQPNLDPSKTPQSASPERRWVTNTAQVFIQWMPLGGSGAAFISFLRTQDWIGAGLTFPVLIVTTIWAAYTESFLERLREVAKNRGSGDVDRLGSWLGKQTGAIGETVRWQLSGFEDQYLQCQAGFCRDYTVEGQPPAGLFVPTLKEVFVPLELSELFMRGADGNPIPFLPGLQPKAPKGLAGSDGLEERHLEIWDLLKRVKEIPAYRQMLIKAWGGYGKTTLLRHLTYTYGEKNQPFGVPKFVPFLIYLRDWQTQINVDLPTSSPIDLPELIEQHHLKHLPGGKTLTPPPRWAANLLGSGGALVMLDGFDEVSEINRPGVSRWIGQQMQAYPKSVFLITSRPNAFNENYKGIPPTTSLFVKPFNRKQQERFLRQWYECQERYARGGRKTPEVQQTVEISVQSLLAQLDQRSELADLAKNPLLLNLIATFHRFYPGQELPQRKGELYQEICKLQLGARPLSRRVEMPLTWEESQEVLQVLALDMVKAEKRTMTQDPLLELLEKELKKHHVKVSAKDFLSKIVKVSELLVEREAQEYEFSHISFQNYLAAVEIKATQTESLLLQNYAKPFWKETILLYGTQARNPAPLIQKLCEIADKDNDKIAVDLAYTCWKESPRQLDSAVAAELEKLWESLQDLRFRDLERFLSNQQWRNADQETYRLMITIVGKEDGQWFEEKDLLEFPCAELKTIDRLWLQASQGRYGFSVQKEIYVRCGAKLNGNYPGTEIWEQFGTEVGWRVNDSWQNYNEWTWNSMGVPGHLPAWWSRGGWGVVRWGGSMWSLFSRIKTCEV